MLVFSTSSRRFSTSWAWASMMSLVRSSMSVRARMAATLSSSRFWALASSSLAASSADLDSAWLEARNPRFCSSNRSRVRCMGRRLRRATNDSSPARVSTQLSMKVTLSKSRFSTLRRRSSKNCSEIRSRSAMTIARTSVPPESPVLSKGVNSGPGPPRPRSRPGNIRTTSWSPEVTGCEALNASDPASPRPMKTIS